MTIGALPMACTEIGTEFATATPFTLANATLRALGGLGLPYNVSSWVGKSNADFTMTAGAATSYTGFVRTQIGSVSPATFNGITIDQLYSNVTLGAPLAFQLLGGFLGQSYFTSLTINGATFLSADAAYLENGSASTWTWAVDPGLANGGVYPVVIV